MHNNAAALHNPCDGEENWARGQCSWTLADADVQLLAGTPDERKPWLPFVGKWR